MCTLGILVGVVFKWSVRCPKGRSMPQVPRHEGAAGCKPAVPTAFLYSAVLCPLHEMHLARESLSFSPSIDAVVVGRCMMVQPAGISCWVHVI